MYRRGLIFYWLVLNVFWKNVHASEPGGKFGSNVNDYQKSTYTPSDLLSTSTSAFDECTYDDFACLSMAASDKLGLDAIKTLHKQLDDDEDGTIDYSESDDFLKEELKYDSGAERRQKAFHRNNDMHISVKELWEAWLRSEVHNWTVEQTTDWLAHTVNLPQYVPNFVLHRVAGANLPRLAVNNAHYLAILGIKDPIHKQKISLKAMDVVLFGPPKDGPTWKDITLILLIIVGGLGSYYAYYQNKKFKEDLTRMNKDMDSLQHAEKALENLQKELEQAKQAQESVITEKINLEKKLEDTHSSLPSSYSDLEVSQLKAEIEMLRTELQIAEGELKDRCWAAPPGLQQWLQLTHEVENKSYLKKRLSAEKQLQQAREACEKLRKKRSSLVGAFVSTHGKSIDEVDRSIVEARTALNEVTQELQERVHRWKQIEMLCGFNIINNNGFQFLENVLYRNTNGRALRAGRMSSTDELEDDTGSIYGSHGGYSEGHHWKDGDSSSSETSKLEDDNVEIRSISGRANVQFVVGDGEEHPKEQQVTTQKSFPKLSSNPKSASQTNLSVFAPKPLPNPMIRSASHDTNIVGPEAVKPKTSLSDTSLENKPKPLSVKHMTIQEQPSISVEDDICSTDSSLMDEGDIKKKRRKLFTFTKKSKNKAD